jgi:hypothetical protein
MPITLNGSTGVTYPDGVLQSSGTPAPGTAGNVLTSNGTIWTSAAPGGGFDSGTVMLFAQTTAPTGWTKNTTTGDNSALRVVTGSASTGGSVAFTTAFATNRALSITAVSGSAGATTLSTPEIPSHTHTIPVGYTGVGGVPQAYFPGPTAPQLTSASTGGGGSHSHPFSFSSASGTVDVAVQYIDVIRASKN